MSWTSEFEPPPPRPVLEPEDYVGDGIEIVDHDSPAAPDADTGSANGGDSFGDGPLDPSVFDGLFDDLDEPGRSGTSDGDDAGDSDSDPESDGDQPSAFFEDAPDPHVAVESEPEFEPEQRELVVVDPLPAQPIDQSIDEGIDQFEPVPVEDGYDTNGHDTNGYAADEFPADEFPAEKFPVDEFPADEFTADNYVEDDYVVADDFQEIEIVESSDQILHEAIQQNPGIAEPSIEHRDPAPYEPTELDNLDAEYEESIQQRDSAEQHESVQQQEPVFVDPLPQAELAPAPSLPPVVHYDPAENVVEDATAQVQPVEEVAKQTGNQQLEYAETKRGRRWPAFVAATVIGASLGVIGALVLFQAFRPDNTEVAAPAPATPVATTIVVTTESSVDVVQPEEARSGLTGLAAAGRFELNTIQFVSGTVELTEASEDILADAVAAITEQPDAPLSIDIRTFSEPTPSANRELSGLQGLSIQERLVELGIPADSIKLNPLGAAPFDPAQPVQSFVVPSSGLDGSTLRDATQQVSPFAIGLDPVTNQLRPESLSALDLLGETMASDVSASLSLAAYSYSGEGAERNREMASVAAEAAAAFLVTNHDIDRTRISILTPGQIPYVIGAQVGNHIFLEWGDGAEIAQNLQAINLSAVAFAPGSSRLAPETIAVLDEILAVVADSETTLVIGVHTATERSDEVNASLSIFQAEAIVQHLAAGGIGEQRVRAYGIGNLRQFDGQDVPSAVVITALP